MDGKEYAGAGSFYGSRGECRDGCRLGGGVDEGCHYSFAAYYLQQERADCFYFLHV
ncbi:hypothetical protein [Coprobacter secundus]|uniref:hypothetical protein n=1 Tax=Coprobacter secundus TaxID=1501392 RepID=UPI0023F928AC|nr:hypothetical protein [Coprobacter secundus]